MRATTAAIAASTLVVLAATGLVGCALGRSDERGTDGSVRTSTTYVLEAHDYRAGDCVLFDQGDVGRSERSASIVPCDASHVLELTGSVEVEVPGDRYPGDRLDGLTHDRCVDAATRHLGQPLLEGGRFALYGLGITPRGWAAGERTYWCGLAEMDPRSIGSRTAVLRERSTKGDSQLDDPAVGTCQPSYDQATADPDLPHELPCTSPHGREVVGEVPVTEDHWDDDADSDANEARIDAGCVAALDAYAGADHPGIHATNLGISEADMALGDRDITCVAVRDDHAPLTASVRAG